MLTFIVYLLTVHLLFSASTMAGNSPAYTPTDYILLSCGASSNAISEDGRKWFTNERSKFSTFNSKNTSYATTASIQHHSVTQVPYMTARVFNDKFTYSFPASSGLKLLRFYFYPVQYSGFDATTSFFSVTANNYLLLKILSAYLTIFAEDGGAALLLKEYMVPVSGAENLNVTFLPLPNSLTFVNGIEVVSMPNMYRNHKKNSVTYAISTPFDIPDAMAFETVYRLSVGGATVVNVDDTGMFRTWRDDSSSIFGAAAGVEKFCVNV